MSVVKVLAGGRVFERYEQMRIYSDLYSLADTFSFAGVDAEAKKTVKCGQRCKISIDGKIVMHGIITDTRISVGRHGTSFDFAGVDICGYLSKLTVADIVEWETATASDIVAELKKQIPFMAGVSIVGLENLETIESVMISTGQQISTVFNMICDKTNSIFYALADGTIKFGKKAKGGSYHSIVMGKDGITKATLEKSITDVCEKIVYKCENENGTIFEQTVAVTGVPALNITQYSRVSAEPAELAGLAQKQANDIRGEYKRLNIDFAGFTDSAGKVWEINKGAVFSDLTNTLENGSFVVESVEFSDTRNEGHTATVKMSLTAAY